MDNLTESTSLAKKPATKIIVLFWVLTGLFILFVGTMLISPFRELIESISISFSLVLIIFFIAGAIQLFLTLKSDIEKKMKNFLILVGISAVSIIVGIFLHNAFYALAVLTENIVALNYVTEGLHVFFFIVSTVVAPIVFLVGAVGTIALLIKSKKA